MDDADATLLRHRDREARFCDGVHRRADDGNVQINIAREPCLGVGQRRNYIGMSRQQQNIIEGKSLRNRKMNHSDLTCFPL